MKKDILYKAAEFYKQELQDRVFHLRAGRKGTTIEFNIIFKDTNFYHLAGLHKLIDIPELRYASNIVYNAILAKRIKYEDIERSDFIDKIKYRLIFLTNLKEIMQAKNLILQSKKRKFFDIEADFALTEGNLDNGYCHLFLKQTGEEVTVPVSYVYQHDSLYIRNNPNKWTVLSIKEIPQKQKLTEQDELVIDKIRKSNSGDLYAMLVNGDSPTGKKENDEGCLMHVLSSYTDDVEQAMRIYKTSALYGKQDDERIKTCIEYLISKKATEKESAQTVIEKPRKAKISSKDEENYK